MRKKAVAKQRTSAVPQRSGGTALALAGSVACVTLGGRSGGYLLAAVALSSGKEGMSQAKASLSNRQAF